MENELVTKRQVTEALIGKVEPDVIQIVMRLPSADANRAERNKGFGKGYILAVRHERRHCKKHPEQYVRMCEDFEDGEMD